MRAAMLALVVIGLLAAPSLGVLNFKVTADGPIVGGKVQLVPGETTTIRFWGQGTNSGLFSVTGEIRASVADPVLLAANSGSFVFSPDFQPTAPFAPKPGTPGLNGGSGLFATQQTSWFAADPNIGRADYVEVCHYTVTAAAAMGDVTLSYVAWSVSQYPGNRETDGSTAIGMLTPVTIHVTPEPVTLALLALGGLVVARRRHS